MNLAELKQRTIRRIDDLTGGPTIVTTGDVINALNEAQRLWAAATLCVERTASVNLGAGVTWYFLEQQFPDWFLPLRCGQRAIPPGPAVWGEPQFDAVLFDQAGAAGASLRKVRPASINDLNALDTAWQTRTSDTTQRYGVLGWDLLYVYPTPVTDDARLEFKYAALPNSLALDADIPEVPEVWHQSLIDIAVHTLLMGDGGKILAAAEPGFRRGLNEMSRCTGLMRQRSKVWQYDNEPAEWRVADLSKEVRARGAV